MVPKLLRFNLQKRKQLKKKTTATKKMKRPQEKPNAVNPQRVIEVPKTPQKDPQPPRKRDNQGHVVTRSFFTASTSTSIAKVSDNLPSKRSSTSGRSPISGKTLKSEDKTSHPTNSAPEGPPIGFRYNAPSKGHLNVSTTNDPSSKGHPTVSPTNNPSSKGLPVGFPINSTSSKGHPTVSPATSASSKGHPTVSPAKGQTTVSPKKNISSSNQPAVSSPTARRNAATQNPVSSSSPPRALDARYSVKDAFTVALQNVTLIDPIPYNKTSSLYRTQTVGNNLDRPSTSSRYPPSLVQISPPLPELVEFQISYNRVKYEAAFPLQETVRNLKSYIQHATGLPVESQQLFFRTLARDDETLKDLGVRTGSEVILIGASLSSNEHRSPVSDVVSLSIAPKAVPQSIIQDARFKERYYKHIVDKGTRKDAMRGYVNLTEMLPNYPLTGMVNSDGEKVRLQIKLDIDELWISTKAKTDKIPIAAIADAFSKPIQGQEEYHVLGLRLRDVDVKMYWLVWVPAQFTDAIIQNIL